ncbi:MAG: hypothetical protein Q8P05_00535 [Candidatus Diapherotrites archaeon]|nr:hypothetical protein [Candidatus Diapherotrites archaeon]
MGFFQKLGKTINVILKREFSSAYIRKSREDWSGIYHGEVSQGKNKGWSGLIYFAMQKGSFAVGPLPAFYRGRKIKHWVRVDDDETNPHRPIFYKQKRRNRRLRHTKH